MINECRGKITLSTLKCMLFGTILFGIGAQIGFAVWGKYIILATISPVQRRHVKESENQPLRAFSRLNTEITINNGAKANILIRNNISNVDGKMQGPNVTAKPNREWVSSNIECFYNTESTRSPEDGRNFQTLPEKYLTNVWPPVLRRECGTNGLLRPWALDKVKKRWMVFVVKSAIHHFSLRNAVRSSWGSVYSIYNQSLVTVFLLGRPPTTSGTEGWQEALAKENEIFGDILQCDVVDCYQNLPNKVMNSFHWILKQEDKDSFYTFTDDDCMMRASNIYIFFNHLTRQESEDNLYCGFLYDRDNTAIRSAKSKWSVNASQYSARYYPTFCHGGMYTLKRRLIQSLYCMSEITNTTGFSLEDVLITGILREKIGNGDSNIKPVTTKSGRKLEMMYYPWEEHTARALWKMKRKWESWSRVLLHYRKKNLLKWTNFTQYRTRKDMQFLQTFWKEQGMHKSNA